jgi:hypothetical protein
MKLRGVSNASMRVAGMQQRRRASSDIRASLNLAERTQAGSEAGAVTMHF